MEWRVNFGKSLFGFVSCSMVIDILGGKIAASRIMREQIKPKVKLTPRTLRNVWSCNYTVIRLLNTYLCNRLVMLVNLSHLSIIFTSNNYIWEWYMQKLN